MLISNPGRRIEKHIEKNIDKLKTILPGVVSSVNRDKLTVNVFIKTVLSDTPVHIKDVRVLYPQTRTNKILYNIEKGDTVMLLFSKHSLDSLINDNFINVRKKDRFNIEDVVAIPGIHLDQDLMDNSEYRSLQDVPIKIPEGMHILSDDNIYIMGENVELENINNLKFKDGSELVGANFKSLYDTPNSYDEQSGKIVSINDEEDGLKFIEVGEIQVGDFINLGDTPSSYSGSAGKDVVVNDEEDGLEFRERGDFTDINLKVKLYLGEEEPTLPEGSLALWNDNGSLWLVYNLDGENKMVEMT